MLSRCNNRLSSSLSKVKYSMPYGYTVNDCLSSLNSNKHISLSVWLYLHDIEPKANYLLFIFVCDM